ncbi:MAG: VWA domain-containing protein [Pseudomonadota bacterium]
MRRSVGVAFGIGALFLAGWNSVACSSSDPHSGLLGDADTGATADSGGNGNSLNLGGNGNALNLGGNGSGNGTGNGPASGDPPCAGQISTAQAIPLDIYIMLDVSGSMLDLTATQATKWDAVKLALESFLKDKASAGLGVGLQYFPLQKPNVPASCSNDAQCGDSGPCFLKFCKTYPDIVSCQADANCVTDTGRDYGPCEPVGLCSKNQDYFCRPGPGNCDDLGDCEIAKTSICLHTSSCDVAQYTAPASAVATLPNAATGLIASIDSQMPNGDTPTGPALSGAIQQARTWASAHPGHRVVAVLATDGLPTECTPTKIDAVAALARAGVTGSPSINTFVIGVFGPDDVANDAPTNLDTIAQQGGTNKAFIVDTQKDVTAQFQAALDAIRGARLACEFQIPEPSSGGALNYKQVNVTFSNGTQKSVTYFVKNAAACDPSSGGWYYDVDPDAVPPPSKIIACPTTCSAFQAAPSGASVAIELGCKTVIK